ncbi:PPOX class F420-dependent oxidoreductase [Umezawaea sp. Da 62-37]|uniref:PPOX class F420-dependent oxidoreductase n=1 Tax=Umezawaea sp. Da 62-37 TaxID=3075927 RepID=UPI0028F745F7|nr:PPOX class F420-dependent oxidoreductase [Umezawaea sp. Da 62-37]WNV81909.1 PPOX class F420-dependent oxidoreductase [Umezawaea sp. Da 62-37]
MATSLSDTGRALLDDKNFATIATINPDGSPQTSVVWIKRDGDDLLMSTVEGRKKDKNLRRDPRVSVSVFDLQQPYSYIEVRGTATLSTEGGRELIDELSRKYRGEDYTADGPDAVRVVIRLTPDKITGYAA